MFVFGIDVKVQLGRAPEAQMLDRALTKGRSRGGTRVTAGQIASQYKRTTPSIYAMILAESDSLLLSGDQVSAPRTMERSYVTSVDSVWQDVGRELASLPNAYDANAAQRVVDLATDGVWALGRQEGKGIAGILSPLQIALAPSLVQLLIRSDQPIGVRMTV
ncbi:MAG: hypothetical protein JWL60_470 [Gemmatimonadetes bacterium]|nr:hypothetical protein [Gemmatimonadota bacterium]